MKATIFQDRQGNLHIFKGDVEIETTVNALPTSGGKEADLFIQSESDKEAILDSLTFNEADSICSGYVTEVDHLDSLYFEHC